MKNLPDTNIQAVFIQKPISGFAPIFYGPGEGSAAMLSVNAGNSIDLYVGGDGINGGFNHALSAQDTDQYAIRHKALLSQVRNGGPNFEVYSQDDPTAFSMVYDKLLTDKPMYYDGLCYADIFGYQLRPKGNPNNTGMLYAAPPYGGNYINEATFLNAIKDMAKNIAMTVGQYNSIAKMQQVPKIKTLRLCLYSSGIYNQRFHADLNKIALNIYDGLHEVLQNNDCGLTTVEFPYNDSDTDPLFNAVKKLL